MKQTVELLREGWYGSGDKYPLNHPYRKKEACCEALVKNSIDMATKKFVPLCKGIEGSIGSLRVDENYKPESVNLPIDTLVMNVANQEDDDALEGELEAAQAIDDAVAEPPLGLHPPNFGAL